MSQAKVRFAPINHALAVTVEPFKFSPAEPVAYESSQKRSTTVFETTGSAAVSIEDGETISLANST